MKQIPHTPAQNEPTSNPTFIAVSTLLQRFGVKPDALAMFCGRLRVRHIEKKEFLVRQGEVCRHIAFINKGLMRLYYVVGGEEHIRQFHFENTFCSDYQSVLTQQPALMSLQALEDSELLIISYDDLQNLFARSPEFERMGRIIAEQAFIFVSQRFASMLLESPEKRYTKLVHERPKVIQRVPQYMIASYLGITPEALSRIRKRLAEH